MEMASSKVEISSCQTFNCVLTPHDRCTRGDNKKNNQKNNNNVRNIVSLEKNLNIFVRDNLENLSVSVGDCDDSTKSSVSDQRLSKTEESEPNPRFSDTGQPDNSPRNEAMAASSLVQIWEARTTQQTSSSNQSQIDSRTSSLGSNLLENAGPLSEETVKESARIHPIEEDNTKEGDMEFDSQLVPPLDSGEKDKEGVRVLDIIRKLSNDSETLTNHENGNSSYDSSKEVQPTEVRCFPQVACSPRIRGRQAFTDLLEHMMRDREKELACILDRHSVSKFTHRGRIQSTLKIRCYERCIAIQDRCKSSTLGSNLNRSPQGSCVMQLLREKYKKNSENIETGASSSSVSSRDWLPEKDPHKATEKKVSQETTENVSARGWPPERDSHKVTEKKVSQETTENVSARGWLPEKDSHKATEKKVSQETTENVSSRGWLPEKDPHKATEKNVSQETTENVSARGWLPERDSHKVTEKKVSQETTENKDLKKSQEMISAVSIRNKAVFSETAENKSGSKKPAGEIVQKEPAKRRGENPEIKEKSSAKESLEGRGEKRELTKEKAITKESSEGGIAEKVNLWNSEEKTRRRGIDKGKVEGKCNNTTRAEKNDVLEEATRRTSNVESAERSITTSNETVKQCEFFEKEVRRKKKEACVSVESKSKEIEDRNINPQEFTAQTNCGWRKPASEEKTTEKSDLKKCNEKESRDGKGERQEIEESVEENTLMGTAEKVNLWNSKEKQNRRSVMEKGKGKDNNSETNEVLKEASRRIINVETAEKSITSLKETVGKVVGTQDLMDKMETSRETTQSVETNSKQNIENINKNTQEAPKEEKSEIPRNSEAKSTKENDRNSSEEVTQQEESVSNGSREKDKEKDSPQWNDETSILRKPNDQTDIKELEDEETKKVEHEEKGESVKEAAVEFVKIWDEEEEVYENTDDWIYEISRPRSYWEDLRKERYLEVINTESDKSDICNLIDRRTVSNFLTSDLRKKIDNLMISRVQGHVRLKINKEAEEEEEEEWRVECSASNQEDNETEEEPEHVNLEVASDVCSQSSARSSAMVSWSFTDQDTGKDQDMTASLSLPEPSVSTNHSMQEMQMMSDLRGEMQQLQREMLELRNSVKSCIDMQIQFQKSITQDLSLSGSSPEQRVDTKKDPLKRKCCICSEMPVDSLLYRCGHMCTCLKCAHELQWSSKKCPICMAPIVDVVRAFLDS